jgi:hypothetical protein
MQNASLYAVREFADVFVDAAVRDQRGELLFLSMFGRDTVILQFLASFSLPAGQGGRRDFTLVRGHEQHSIALAEPEKLQKLTGRLPRNTLFGNLTHTWLYREDAIKPDRANRRALLLRYDEAESAAAFADRVWLLLRDLCPVPLLDHWREPLMTALEDDLVTPLMSTDSPPIGKVDGAHVTIPEGFEDIVSMAVATGALTLDVRDMQANASHQVARAAQVASRTQSDTRDPLFDLGQVVCTPGIQELIERNAIHPPRLLHRHERGDWGVMSDFDRDQNNLALRNDTRTFSSYPIDPDQPCTGSGSNTVWIITEADRSVTTLLLPSEY